MDWKFCVIFQCSCEAFTQRVQTFVRRQAFICYRHTVRPRRRNPMSLLAPENPEIPYLTIGFGEVHKLEVFWPWSPMGTCSSGWQRVQIFGVDRAEWLSTVFILDSQSGHKIVVSLSVPWGLNQAGVFGKYQSYLCVGLMENMMPVASFGSHFFPLCPTCNVKSGKHSIVIVKVFMYLVDFIPKLLS